MKEVVKEYIIVTEFGTETLTNAVNAKIKEGWQPEGSIAMTYCTDFPNEGVNSIIFCQAMVR